MNVGDGMPEIDGPTPEQWCYLRQNPPLTEDSFSERAIRLDDEETQARIALDNAGMLHLLIPVERGPSFELPPDLTGLRIRHRLLDRGEVMDVFSPQAHEAVFSPFCRRLLQAVLNESRDPWAAAKTEVRSWASALKAPKNDFSRITQIGLFGELWVLGQILLPVLGSAVVDYWTGPDRERHDFVGTKVHIEVKTTTRSDPQFHISRLDQLCLPDGKQLVIAAIQIEESKGAKATVATMLDNIRDRLADDAGALDQFLGKLAASGWYEELRRSGELLHFSMRDIEFFEVGPSFPRLPDHFVPPTGVKNIEYDVNLSNLSALDKSEVRGLISLMLH